MNGLRKRKKFSKDHFFTFTQAVHASSVIYARENYATVEIHL